MPGIRDLLKEQEKKEKTALTPESTKGVNDKKNEEIKEGCVDLVRALDLGSLPKHNLLAICDKLHIDPEEGTVQDLKNKINRFLNSVE